MRTTISHEFVDTIPDHLDDGVVYISIPYATAVHRCCCGCGHEVVTPLHPRQWSLTFDGESISLTPSIGNWSFPCRSHYWVRTGRVHRAHSFADAEIVDLRVDQRAELLEHFERPAGSVPEETASLAESWWKRLAQWLGRRFR
ncbi:DUF6527 family protein [Lentzea albidocapillata]|uniref:DUF6527 family protein n=1 Tax=Lentzea albidocapillata TaxID=40571 RepID=UPI0004C45C7B